MQLDQKADCRPWPLAGYAPGNYTCKCIDCEERFSGDKRAIRCLECAAVVANQRLQAVQPVPVVTDEYASATYTDEQKRKLQADAGIPNIPTNLTYECRLAISGEGERSYDWSDKPHRLVYDLCRQIEALTATASAEPVGYRWQWSVRNDGEWYYGPHHPVDGSQSSIDGDPDIIEPLYAAPVSGADNAK